MHHRIVAARRIVKELFGPGARGLRALQNERYHPSLMDRPVNVEACSLYFLRIPLRMSVTHGARMDRTFSDSVVVRMTSGSLEGYGEAVIRDYVSGSLGSGDEYRREAVRVVSRLVAPFAGRYLSWTEARRQLAGVRCDSRALPFLCAVEAALLDLACKGRGVEIFSVLEKPPVREAVFYGGVLPILPVKEAEKNLRFCLQLGLPDIKLKLNGDLDFDSSILSLSRGVLGKTFDIRVDANSSWPVADSARLFDLCRSHGVSLVEQPFEDSAPGVAEVLREARSEGFSIMADEGVLSSRDVRRLAEAGTYSAVNLRLSKNGGLSRVLALADEAAKSGLSYQLGCMVGETGILSALGRAAACLLPSPLYVEGSYDDVILTDNITTKSMGFGPRGQAPVIRDAGAGYEVSAEKLDRLSVARMMCL